MKYLNLKKLTRAVSGEKGFAMLFSVLVSSLLVAIGLSIFNITLKELTISTAGRESQIAFYAANSGMECALYWQFKQDAFATSTSDISRATDIDAKCNDSRVNGNAEIIFDNSNSATTEKKDVYVDTADTNGPCFDIRVERSASGGKLTTIIKSQGRNICATSGRRVERGLQATITIPI